MSKATKTKRNLEQISEQSIPDGKRRKSAGITSLAKDINIIGIPPSIVSKAHEILRTLYGSDAKFKSLEQKYGLYRVIQGMSPLAVVLPTGGGKSTLFQGLALQNLRKVNIVVVPFIALREELNAKSNGLGIQSYCWKGYEESVEGVSLIFVTVEGAVMRKFKDFLKFLKEQGKLGSIFLDEAHMLISTCSFRSAYKELDWLAILNVQIVLLTATLPSTIVGPLQSAMSFQKLSVVRGTIHRPSISYIIMRTRAADQYNRLKDIIILFGKIRKNRDRALIYTRSVKECEKVSKEMGCAMYHAGWSKKESEYKKWVEGSMPVMIATTALGAGIDLPSIRLVLHYKAPFTLTEFVQSSGRAGRDGKRSESICLLSLGDQGYRSNAKKEFPEEVMGLVKYVTTEGCRRVVIGRFFDGEDGAKKCRPKIDELCDNCRYYSETKSAQGGDIDKVQPGARPKMDGR